MRITTFTSNQPRHVALIEALRPLCDELWVVQECATVFPGAVQDFYRKSPVMQDYFTRVLDAERSVFGGPRFAPPGTRTLSIRMGDLSMLPLDALAPALGADVFVVFGASYIRGPLCDLLVSRRAINLHMGISPHYRGSSTNFWALYDGRPELVGATIHRLTRGLDSGPILMHVFPPAAEWPAFELGMQAVRAGQEALAELIRSGASASAPGVPQDRALEIRYTRHADFTDAVASEFLGRLPDPRKIRAALAARDDAGFVRAHGYAIAAPRREFAPVRANAAIC
ncbi:MAG: methionyl-tRNA formyltransferase [Phycisphaerae bacterium]|jgi:hypothetical protein